MKTLLIIEDDIDTRELMAYLFEDAGFNVIQSDNVIPIGSIIELAPHIILVDHHLMGNKGGDFCSAVKANPVTKCIPIIILSANNQLKNIAAKANADAFIAKPFDIYALAKLVKDLV